MIPLSHYTINVIPCCTTSLIRYAIQFIVLTIWTHWYSWLPMSPTKSLDISSQNYYNLHRRTCPDSKRRARVFAGDYLNGPPSFYYITPRFSFDRFRFCHIERFRRTPKVRIKMNSKIHRRSNNIHIPPIAYSSSNQDH